jgi:hypothetical protein
MLLAPWFALAIRVPAGFAATEAGWAPVLTGDHGAGVKANGVSLAPSAT